MEQAVNLMNRKTGWSDYENKLLWETADEAQTQGLPLKAVFERISEKTGRRPNSIRNYYYAQVRQHEGDSARAARFTPFTQDEVDSLMESVLRSRAEGKSVRACLQELSGGDHSLMLRYQNKYRSVIKSRPEYVSQVVDRLNNEGVECDAPKVNHRKKVDIRSSCDTLIDDVRSLNDTELSRAIDVLAKHIAGDRARERNEEIITAAEALINPIYEFAAYPTKKKSDEASALTQTLIARMNDLRSALGVRNSDI